MRTVITIGIVFSLLISCSQSRMSPRLISYDPQPKGLLCYDSVSFITREINDSVLLKYDTVIIDYKIVMKSSHHETKRIDSISVKKVVNVDFDSDFWDVITVYGWNADFRKYELLCTWGLDFGTPIMTLETSKKIIKDIRNVIIDDLETHLYYYEKSDWIEYCDIYKHSEKDVIMNGVLRVYDGTILNYFVTGL